MKREQREIFRALTSVTLPFPGGPYPLTLCGACKYAVWSGDCKWPEGQCSHPLAWRHEWMEEMWPWSDNTDCWAFRPGWTVDMLAEYIGQRLQGAQVDLP